MLSIFKTKKQKLAEQKAAEEAERKAREEAERQAREEARRKAQKEAEQKFVADLAALPAEDVTASGEKAKHNTLSSMPEYSYSNITKKTKKDGLGNFVVIDVETTGLQPTRHEIVEVSAVRFRDWEPVGKYTTLCFPRKGIEQGASNVNGITADMVEGCPAFDEIVPSLLAFIGSDNVVGHNLEFDIRFLWHFGLDLFQTKRRYFDTLDLAERTLKRFKRKYDKEYDYYDYDILSGDVYDYKLGTLCDYYRIPFFGAHRSLADAYVTGFLFQHLVEERTE